MLRSSPRRSAAHIGTWGRDGDAPRGRVAFSFQFAIFRRSKLRKEKLLGRFAREEPQGLATYGGPMQLSVAERATQAHGILRQSGTVPTNLLAAEIYESWLRCVALGLDVTRPPSIDMASPKTLRSEQEQRVLLRGLALAEMRTLHDQIAGSNFLIAFATPEGLLLDIVADKSFADTPEAKNIRPGSLWSETLCGTNGIGTAAFLKRPVVVHGSEHYFPSFGSLTCAASPIFAPDGSLAGILDASSDCVSRQTHTAALVCMATTQIENGLFRERHHRDILIAFHNRGEYLHTLTAGLLAVDDSGRILAANQAARILLHGLPTTPGRSFTDIFRTGFSSFMDEGRLRERQRLQDEVGSSFIATIEHPNVSPMLRAVTKPRVVVPPITPTPFISIDPVVARIVRQTEAAAQRKMPVLIRGETGTGKEQLARHAHAASGRSGAFVAVNCAALPESLIEAELFGYGEGAFTGARKGGSSGLVKEADGGTLFLDEIGDMPVTLQAVLLRFLDDWTVRPVGGAKRQVDVLLISATNADLGKSIAKGRFRSDLLFRLNTLEVTLPPLAERSDFQAIAGHLLATIDARRTLSPGLVEHLAKCAWPGNIRELRNVLSRLTLQTEDSVIDYREAASIAGPQLETKHSGTLHGRHRAQVLSTYAETGNNISETARRLGVSRNTIYRALDDPSAQR
jgi:sigma-54 dependent transcriptional regulator, acetoin dehydrogenase operon transcriptional activator AcoR